MAKQLLRFRDSRSPVLNVHFKDGSEIMSHLAALQNILLPVETV